MDRRCHRCGARGRPDCRYDLTEIPQLDLFGNVVAAPAADDRRTVGPAPVAPDLADIASRLPPCVRLGTSSWSFPGWAGIVYDGEYTERQLASEGLTAYAKHPALRAVGIDRSYYAPLDEQAYAAYARAVPEDFRFLVKAERLLVLPDIDVPGRGAIHNDRFLDPDYARDVIIEPVLRGLEGRAGPILFQFSPMHPQRVGGPDDFAARLREFLTALPRGPLYAVELRTPELFTPAYADAIDAADAVHGYTVHGSMIPIGRQLTLLRARRQRALVIRWMLHERHGYQEARAAYAPFNRVVDVDDESRNAIVDAAIEAADERRDAYVIVNNKAEGSSPLSVFALEQLMEGRLAARAR